MPKGKRWEIGQDQRKAPVAMTRQRQVGNKFLDSLGFQLSMMALILLNAIILGLAVSPGIKDSYRGLLDTADNIIVSIFVLEIAAKIFIKRQMFFRSGWDIFDLVIVAAAVLPTAGAFAILRSLRALRLFRMLSIMPKARMTIDALLGSLVGLATSIVLLSLIFYVSAVLATGIFGDTNPQIFGSLERSFVSLYDIMVSYGYASDIVQPVTDANPWAWLFFAPFIIATSFALLNLFIGVISGEVQAQHEKSRDELAEVVADDLATENKQAIKSLEVEIRLLSAQIEGLTQALRNR